MNYICDYNEKIISTNWPAYLSMVTDVDDFEHAENSLLSCQCNQNKYTFYIINRYKNFYHKTPILIVDNKNDAKYIFNKINEYISEYEKFQNLNIKKINNIKNCNVIMNKYKDMIGIVNICKNDTDIGFKNIVFSPFESYLLTNEFTINGSLGIYNKEDEGKGYAKAMFEIIDNNIPYKIIPQGYAMSPGHLSEKGKKFWSKRLNFCQLPKIQYKNKTLDLFYKRFNGNNIENSIFSIIAESLILNKNIYMVTVNNEIIYTCFPNHYQGEIDIEKISIDDLVANMQINAFHLDVDSLIKGYESLFINLSSIYSVPSMELKTMVKNVLQDKLVFNLKPFSF